MPEKMNKSEWKDILSEEQFEVCRNKATEIPFSGKYYETKDKGIYKCVCCDNNLFKSSSKYYRIRNFFCNVERTLFL